jgi:hypothetical protein
VDDVALRLGLDIAIGPFEEPHLVVLAITAHIGIRHPVGSRVRGDDVRVEAWRPARDPAQHADRLTVVADGHAM